MSDQHRKLSDVQKRLRDAADSGCAQSRLLLNRREMLGMALVVAGVGLLLWAAR